MKKLVTFYQLSEDDLKLLASKAGTEPNDTETMVTKTPDDAKANPAEATDDAKANATEATDDAKANATEATDDAKANPAKATDDAKANATEATDDAKANPAEATDDAKANATEATDDAKANATEATDDAKANATEAIDDAKTDDTETTDEKTLSNISIMLREIIKNLEAEHDDYIPAVSAAMRFLITYSSLAATNNSLDKIKDVILRIKQFDISRKELLEFLKALNEDIKNTITVNSICDLLDSFSNLPLDGKSQELLKLVKSKVQNTRF